MKIAIVAPSHVPFIFGGAERVWLGLAHYFTYETGHACELIKLPSPERNFREIVSSYQQFSQLDLSHFDLVISGKYPAWMVAHPNHAVYMLHRLRGLYDTWPQDIWPQDIWPHDLSPLLPGDTRLDRLRRVLEHPSTCRTQLPMLFGEIDRLLATDIPQEWLALPAPLIRAVVHKLDSIGMSPEAISKYVAISRNVAQREGYFPPLAEVSVAPVPSDLALALLKDEQEKEQETDEPYFFTVSRHDHAKRIGLIIEAFRRLEPLPDYPARLVIAGDGPDTPRLVQLAQGDPRILFTGRLGEDELARRYREAVAVPFVPYDEDFGLVTLEAMAAGTPVLTASDSGGPLEFVEDGVTGFVSAPEPAALAEAMAAILVNPDNARQMGEAARERVKGVTWQGLATELVLPAGRRRRSRIVIANTFAMWPPDTGGKRRLWSMAREIARNNDVTVITLGPMEDTPEEITFSSHFREIHIPISREHAESDWALTKLLDETSVFDLSATLYGHLTPALDQELRRRLQGASLAIACHPFLYRFIRAAWEGPIWYDAYNVETLLKRSLLPETPAGQAALAETASVESDCVTGSERLIVVSQEERAIFHEVFDKPLETMVLVPNGTDIPPHPVLDLARRAELKQRLGLTGPVAVFAGSWHLPNLDGARLLKPVAKECPEWTFLMVGSMCRSPELRAEEWPDNVRWLGVLEEAELHGIFAAADVGLNPVVTGGGTSLKIFDYAAHGLLVVATQVGARGSGFVHAEHAIIAEPDEMAIALRAVAGMDAKEHEGMTRRAFAHVRDHFSWDVVVGRLGL